MIAPTAIIHPTARLGKNVHVGHYSTLKDCEIGDGVWIGSHTCIGDEAEHSTEKWELNPRKNPGRVVIGDNVVIREFVTINQPIKDLTFLGNNVYVMARCHVGHDCQVEEDAVISNGTILGGWTRVMVGANLGLGSITHQYTTVGHYAMIAANSAVVKDVPPLSKYIPNKPLLLNAYAVRKWKLPLVGESLAAVAGQDHYLKLLEEWEGKRYKERAVYGP